MYRVLITLYEKFGRFSNGREILKKAGCEIIESPYPHPVEEEDLLKIIKEIDAIVTGDDKLTAKVIEAADKLKIIAKYGVGIDRVDIKAATDRGIPITLAPALSNAVADFTFGVMFVLARGICDASALVKNGEWGKSFGFGWGRSFMGVELWQKTLGIIGAGRIGREVIRRAKGFQMKVLAYDIYRDERIAQQLGFEYTSLERVLREADFVSINVPLTDETKNLINEGKLSLMKPSAYLINTARGQVVDEKALYFALKEKKIAGAALDVFTREPLPSDSPWLSLGNVILTPHIAADTKEAAGGMDLICAENIIRVLRGEKPLYAVNLS
ncbi:phosphoglycerate dehydrogenase [Candidatus Aerophobetes bacterium]|nr:phosphoglycerate dehydrogenase [Candidatus Aerophobetes bacterium]